MYERMPAALAVRDCASFFFFFCRHCCARPAAQKCRIRTVDAMRYKTRAPATAT
jgi:hypothetical protein